MKPERPASYDGNIQRGLLAAVCLHLIVFSLFSFSFRHFAVQPKPACVFLGSILTPHDFSNDTSPIKTLTGLKTRNITLTPEGSRRRATISLDLTKPGTGPIGNNAKKNTATTDIVDIKHLKQKLDRSRRIDIPGIDETLPAFEPLGVEE